MYFKQLFEQVLNESNTLFDKFLNQASKNVNKYTKIPMNSNSDYEGKYVYIQEDEDENGKKIFYWYLLKTNTHKNINDIKKNTILSGGEDGFKSISSCLNNIEDNLS